jgi:hypothetical protein
LGAAAVLHLRRHPSLGLTPLSPIFTIGYEGKTLAALIEVPVHRVARNFP